MFPIHCRLIDAEPKQAASRFHTDNCPSRDQRFDRYWHSALSLRSAYRSTGELHRGRPGGLRLEHTWSRAGPEEHSCISESGLFGLGTHDEVAGKETPKIMRGGNSDAPFEAIVLPLGRS
jgi:hypothetical protein